MKNNKVKKVLKIVGDVVFGIFLVFILFFAISNIRAKSSDNIPNMFGHGYLNVLSNSMEGDRDDSFYTGDLIFVKMVNKEEAKKLKVDDIITYRTIVGGKDMTISHRIVEVQVINEGESNEYTLYLTQGDNPLSQFADKDAIRDDQVLAVYEGKWAGAGRVFAWFSTGFGFFLIVVVPCILFLIFEIINFVKVYMEYKGEKNKVALAGGPDSMQNKIRLRKEAFADLVKDGTLTQEQADAALNDYIKGLMASETPVVIENEVAEEPKEETTNEVKEETPVVEELKEEVVTEPAFENTTEEPVVEEAKVEEPVEDPVAPETPEVKEEVPTEEKVEVTEEVKEEVKAPKKAPAKKATTSTKKTTGTKKTTTKKTTTKKSTEAK